ncbi:MAG: alcohol dehydrogenase, partial [Pseudomonadota bacterium]
NTLANSWWGKAKIGLEYAMSRSGPMSMAPSQLGAFTKSDAAREWANIQYHVQPLSLDAFGEPLHKFPAITASVCNLNPSSRGSVTLKSPDFKVPPAIAPNYLSTEEDRKVAADSLRVTRRIMSQPAMAAFEPEEFKPGIQYQSDEELAKKTTPWRWSTATYKFAAFVACEWLMQASCQTLPVAIPTAPPS